MASKQKTRRPLLLLLALATLACGRPRLAVLLDGSAVPVRLRYRHGLPECRRHSGEPVPAYLIDHLTRRP